MAQTIIQKLRIKPGYRLLTKHAPADFKYKLSGKHDLIIGTRIRNPDQVHWFVKNRKQVEHELPVILALISPGMIVWTYYPKGSSGLQEDLTRDKGWDTLLAENDRLKFISLISFDETWSVFGFRVKSEAEKQTTATKTPREIFDWVDPVKRTVRLPPALVEAFKSNPDAADTFHKLAFTHKKEYIEWVISAKKEETRKARVLGMIDRLKGLLERR